MLDEPKKFRKPAYSMRSMKSKQSITTKKNIKKPRKSPVSKPRRRRKKKIKFVQLPKLTNNQFKEIEIKQICEALKLSRNKIETEVMNLIKLVSA